MEQWTIKVKIQSGSAAREGTLESGRGIDNEAIQSKKGTKWKAGDDLTLQIEGHAPLGATLSQLPHGHTGARAA